MVDFPPVTLDYKKYLSELWMFQGCFAERWEQGFRKYLYHGRTLGYFKSDSVDGTPYEDLALPEILIADHSIEPAPWNNGLRMRNSQDGVVKDNVYIQLAMPHFKQIIAFEANFPSPSIPNPTWLGAGVEVNSGGSFACFYGLACEGGYYKLNSRFYDGNRSENVTLRHYNVYARYVLMCNPPTLELWEAPVASPSGHPLELTKTLDMVTVKGKVSLCLFNESDQIHDVRFGNIWVYEIP